MKKNRNPFFSNNIKRMFNDVTDEQWRDYNWQIRHSVHDYKLLSDYFPGSMIEEFDEVVRKFPFTVTPYVLSLMNPDLFPEDPVARQVIPSSHELTYDSRLISDPFKENQGGHSPLPGLVRRYPDRVVLVTTAVCPSLCRYCTRKWNWNEQFTLSDEKIRSIIAYLRANPEIREVLISGGEPLLLPDDVLDSLLKSLSSVESLEVIRIGSRILTFLPYRLTDALLAVFERYSPLWIVTHFNHPDEITFDTEYYARKIIKSGVQLANQSVLLNGVNNSFEVIKELNYRLQSIMIKPYYLFYPDLIEGTSHFRGSLSEGIEIMRKLRGNCGGLTIPQFVVDLPEGGKVPLLPDYIADQGDGYVEFINYEGKRIRYDEDFYGCPHV